MQFPGHLLVNLLPLVSIASGQLSSNDATLLAWRAYGKFVADYLTVGQGLVKGVDYVVNLYHDKVAGKPSTIIKLTNDSQVKVIRK